MKRKCVECKNKFKSCKYTLIQNTEIENVITKNNVCSKVVSVTIVIIYSQNVEIN